ncbi:MAG: hypothetical protein IJN57_12000 [Oscillospiraceae bacterium]|nr:hypothetical protein [Oscillospiraceae bacterium]
MKKNRTLKTMAALLAASLVCCGSALSASAVTVDDIANKARELGFPEAQVQQGYNEWATGYYTQADLDAAWAALLDYEKQSQEKFESIFEGTQTPTQAPTQAPTQKPTQAPTQGGTQSPTQPPTQPTTKPVGSVDFINMTLDQKIAYVNSLSPADKETFLNNLTPAERNSIIKQMSINDKADLMQGYIDVAEQMGMNVVVNNLTDDNISVTIRNEEGVVIDQSAVGITIDDTGISYTGLYAAAAAGTVLAVGGFIAVYRYLRRTDEEAQ